MAIEREAKIVPPSAELAEALRDWFGNQPSLPPGQLAERLAASKLWEQVAQLHSHPAWEDGFDAGEEDTFRHQTWDEDCIPNPWDATTPYTPAS